MAAPAPETKPKSRTTTSASMFDVFEVLIAQKGGTPSSITPRPRMAYSQADAVLALAETLKTHNILPDEFLDALGDAEMSVVQVRLLECDGRHFEFLRLPASSTPAVIIDRLKDYYPGASRGSVGEDVPEVEAPVEVAEPTVFSNSGSQATSPRSAAAKTAKVRKVTTIYGGGDVKSKSEQIADLTAKLTPEQVARGVVIVMGKNGPKILSTTGARTEEEEAEAMADAEASGEDYIPSEAPRQEVIELPAESGDDPADEAPEPPRTGPALRTLSGSEAERTLKVSSVDHHDREEPDSAELADLDRSFSAQLGITHGAAEDVEVHLAPVVIDQDSEAAVGGLTQVEEVGGRRIKRQEITKRDRGGSRPQRPKA